MRLNRRNFLQGMGLALGSVPLIGASSLRDVVAADVLKEMKNPALIDEAVNRTLRPVSLIKIGEAFDLTIGWKDYDTKYLLPKCEVVAIEGPVMECLDTTNSLQAANKLNLVTPFYRNTTFTLKLSCPSAAIMEGSLSHLKE